MNKLHILLASLFGLGLATACTNETDETVPSHTGKTVVVEANIGQANILRATLGNDDNISYNAFEPNDEIGLFASKGLKAKNQKLTADQSGSFKSEDLQWLGDKATDVFAYFPYSANADSAGMDIWRAVSTTSAYKAGFDDMLAASIGSVPEGTIINLGFTHQFAMLVIKRGAGFKNAQNKNISITLNQPVAHKADITAKGIALKAGTDGKANQLETNPGTYKSDNVDYVIIPVGAIDETAVNVASITLNNDAGRNTIVGHAIKGSPKQNMKYVVTVEMRDNQAVVSPVEIVRWDNEEIQIEEPAGIRTDTQLLNWAAAYNNNNNNTTQDLEQYGSYDSQTKKWTFRLLDNLTIDNDFSGITNFKDIFDGQGHTITGLNIKEVSGSSSEPTGFTRTLSGTIQRLILKDAVIYAQTEVGAFAGKTAAGAVLQDCMLTGTSIIYGTAAVGAFIGNNEGSTNLGSCSQSPTVIVKQGN